MAYAIGHISGCHLNPAVSVGLCMGKRFPASELVPYIIAQVLGATAGAGVLYKRAPQGFAPIAIGLGLTLIHLIGIPVTNTSVNPARSTGPALFVGGWALGQLWLFWLPPILGAGVAGIAYRWMFAEAKAVETAAAASAR